MGSGANGQQRDGHRHDDGHARFRAGDVVRFRRLAARDQRERIQRTCHHATVNAGRRISPTRSRRLPACKDTKTGMRSLSKLGRRHQRDRLHPVGPRLRQRRRRAKPGQRHHRASVDPRRRPAFASGGGQLRRIDRRGRVLRRERWRVPRDQRQSDRRPPSAAAHGPGGEICGLRPDRVLHEAGAPVHEQPVRQARDHADRHSRRRRPQRTTSSTAGRASTRTASTGLPVPVGAARRALHLCAQCQRSDRSEIPVEEVEHRYGDGRTRLHLVDAESRARARLRQSGRDLRRRLRSTTRTSSRRAANTMGRGIFILDATDGSIVWQGAVLRRRRHVLHRHAVLLCRA